MKEQAIKDIIDRYLNELVDINGNVLPIKIEAEMSDLSQDKDEEWRIWFPISSKVKDSEIEEIENRIGYTFPDDYKIFLKHKHFYELQISEASFCEHPVNTWRASLSKLFFENNKFLVDQGYIPFAIWSDWGMLCFDANRNQSDKNYPIILWDHERENEFQDQYQNFYDLLSKLESENS